jgi:hypothetical protein
LHPPGVIIDQSPGGLKSIDAFLNNPTLFSVNALIIFEAL